MFQVEPVNTGNQHPSQNGVFSQEASCLLLRRPREVSHGWAPGQEHKDSLCALAIQICINGIPGLANRWWMNLRMSSFSGRLPLLEGTLPC